MRSFPILCQLTRRHHHISVHAHTELRLLLLSFTPEQRAPWVINQLASELERERQVRFHSNRDVGSELCLGSLFPLWGPSSRLCCGLFYKAFGYLSAWDKQIAIGRICMCVLVFGHVCVCNRLTSGKLLMLTIMTWGDFMETWPSWLRGNFPSWVVTTMWSRAPTQIHINQIVYILTSFYLQGTFFGITLLLPSALRSLNRYIVSYCYCDMRLRII